MWTRRPRSPWRLSEFHGGTGRARPGGVGIPLRLQDWITIGGGASAIVQPESGWIDVSLYQDLVSYIEFADFAPATPLPAVALQSSPTREETYFRDLFSRSAATGVGIDISRFASAASPPARWLRWRASGTPTWRLTFRVWLNANPC